MESPKDNAKYSANIKITEPKKSCENVGKIIAS